MGVLERDLSSAPDPGALTPERPSSEGSIEAPGRLTAREVVSCLTGILLGFAAGYFAGEEERSGDSRSIPSIEAPEVSSGSPSLRAGGSVESPEPRTPREIGNAHYDREEWDLAIRSYEQALQSGDADPGLLSDLAVAYRNRGDSQRAVSTLQQALERDPSHWFSSLNLALIYAFDLSDADAAERHLQDVERVGREFPQRDLVRARIAQLRDAARASRSLPGRKENGN